MSLQPENEGAWQLWKVIQGQWRVGFGGAYALDYGSIFAVARALHIEIDQVMLRKIKALERYELDQQKKEVNDGC